MSASVYSPTTLQEAGRLLAQYPGITVLAGGTDLMVALNAHVISPTQVLDIWRLNELRGIERQGNHLVLGALTTYTQLIESEPVQKHLPILVESARSVGASQIQNRGTVGGNIANASPAGDTLPIFAVCDAELELYSVRGQRRVPFNAFYLGYKKLAKEPDELITRVFVPIPSPGIRQFFRKVGTRRAQAISKVVMACLAQFQGKLLQEIGIAVGSVAPTIIRAPRTEALLRGQQLAPELIQQARESIMQEIKPISDVRSTAEYRRIVTGNILARFLMELDSSGQEG
ncbi:MAG: xanthine dehydrogenase family protein subunit M [Deinococcus sp.]|nr:xanthine dehydrogenase family protein subunit M [Deinococcus sp.]